MKKYFLTFGKAFLVGLFVVGALGVADLLPYRVAEAVSIRYVQAKPAQLYTSIATGATSVRLRSFKDLSGTTLTMTEFGDIGYATIDPGTSREEAVSFTGITDNGDGTVTLTGLSRGYLGRYPYGTGGTAYAHYVNSYFVVTNGADFYFTFVSKDTATTINGQYTFASTSVPQVALNTTYQQLVANGTNTLATLDYVNQTATSGAPNASETVKGLVELATALEQASSTAFGTDTGAPLAMQSRYATDTPLSGCASGYTSTAGAGCSVIATLAGKIKQTWFNLAEAFTFTGGIISTASSTFTATTTFTGNMIGTKIMASSTAGSTITGNTLPQPVSISTSTGRVNPADANDLQFFDNFYGFAVQSGANGVSVLVQTDGIVSGFSGLTPGLIYYVQDTAGTIGTTPGTYEMKVGMAISSSELRIERGNNEYLGSVSFTASWGSVTACSATATSTPIANHWKADVTATQTGVNQYGLRDLLHLDRVGITSPASQWLQTVSGPLLLDPSISLSRSGNVITLSGSGDTNASTNYVCSGTLYMYR